MSAAGPQAAFDDKSVIDRTEMQTAVTAWLA
jgi:hypothetical protein